MATIKRTKNVEEKLVDVNVHGDQIAVRTHEEIIGEKNSTEVRLTIKEAKNLRKQLGQAIEAAEAEINPF